MASWEITAETFLPLAMMMHEHENKTYKKEFSELYSTYSEFKNFKKLKKNISSTIWNLQDTYFKGGLLNKEYDIAIKSQGKEKYNPLKIKTPIASNYDPVYYIKFEFVRQILKYHMLIIHGVFQQTPHKFNDLSLELLKLAYAIGLIPDLPKT